MYIPSEVGGESQLVKKISVLSRFDFFFFFSFLMELSSIKTTIEKEQHFSIFRSKKKKKKKEKGQHCK